MLTNIPQSKLYVLLPVGEPSVVCAVGDTRICGGEGSTLTFSQLLFNHMAMVMDDSDVVGFTGLNLERCMIIVNITKEDINGIIDGGLIALDEVFKEHPHLLPAGGAFVTRDWDDIPDEEKAGNTKK